MTGTFLYGSQGTSSSHKLLKVVWGQGKLANSPHELSCRGTIFYDNSELPNKTRI